MKIDAKEVEHVARLARLKIGAEGAGPMTDQLNSILSYMDKLNELDTGDIEPMAHAIPLATPFREDEAKGSLEPDDALQNAPERQGTFFVVPKVI